MRQVSKPTLDTQVIAVCRRHACTIDLKRSVLTFGSLSSELPFLAEHEIPGYLREEEVIPEEGQSGEQSTERVLEATARSHLGLADSFHCGEILSTTPESARTRPRQLVREWAGLAVLLNVTNLCEEIFTSWA